MHSLLFSCQVMADSSRPHGLHLHAYKMEYYSVIKDGKPAVFNNIDAP